MGIEDLSITSDLKNLAEKLPKEHRAELYRAAKVLLNLGGAYGALSLGAGRSTEIDSTMNEEKELKGYLSAKEKEYSAQ